MQTMGKTPEVAVFDGEARYKAITEADEVAEKMAGDWVASGHPWQSILDGQGELVLRDKVVDIMRNQSKQLYLDAAMEYEKEECSKDALLEDKEAPPGQSVTLTLTLALLILTLG